MISRAGMLKNPLHALHSNVTCFITYFTIMEGKCVVCEAAIVTVLDPTETDLVTKIDLQKDGPVGLHCDEDTTHLVCGECFCRYIEAGVILRLRYDENLVSSGVSCCSGPCLAYLRPTWAMIELFRNAYPELAATCILRGHVDDSGSSSGDSDADARSLSMISSKGNAKRIKMLLLFPVSCFMPSNRPIIAGDVDGEEHIAEVLAIRYGTTERRREEMQTVLWLAEHTRTCTRCGRRVVKDGGCSHMYCTWCGNNFCWLCGKPFSWADSSHQCNEDPTSRTTVMDNMQSGGQTPTSVPLLRTAARGIARASRGVAKGTGKAASFVYYDALKPFARVAVDATGTAVYILTTTPSQRRTERLNYALKTGDPTAMLSVLGSNTCPHYTKLGNNECTFCHNEVDPDSLEAHNDDLYVQLMQLIQEQKTKI
eukprot:Clim_evm16s237 gene=Clim_evmTU16s237